MCIWRCRRLVLPVRTRVMWRTCVWGGALRMMMMMMMMRGRKSRAEESQVGLWEEHNHKLKRLLVWNACLIRDCNRIHTRAGFGSRLLEFHLNIMMIVSLLLLSVLSSGETHTHTHTHTHTCSFIMPNNRVTLWRLVRGTGNCVSPVELVRFGHVITVSVVDIDLIKMFKHWKNDGT